VLGVETVGVGTVGFEAIDVTVSAWPPTWIAEGICAAVPPEPATVTKRAAPPATISEPSHRPQREWENDDFGLNRRTRVSAALGAATSGRGLVMSRFSYI
jgi:hypothetical protein